MHRGARLVFLGWTFVYQRVVASREAVRESAHTNAVIRPELSQTSLWKRPTFKEKKKKEDDGRG